MAETTVEEIAEVEEVPEEVPEFQEAPEVGETEDEGLSTEEDEEPPSEDRHDQGEESEEEPEAERDEISEVEHAKNVTTMGEVLYEMLGMIAEGKIREKRMPLAFEMKQKTDSADYLLAQQETDEKDAEVKMQSISMVESETELLEEEEEEETKTCEEALLKRQQLLAEFYVVHDEAQQLRLMNVLLHSKLQRLKQQRSKSKAASSSSAASSVVSASPLVDTATITESLLNELHDAAEVRQQLDAELDLMAGEEKMRKRLAAAHQQLDMQTVKLKQLQSKTLACLHASPTQRQDAEHLLKQIWPQLQQLRTERLRHTRASNKLEDAKKKVANLEEFGPHRTVTVYEQLLAEGLKLAERVMERKEQLAALHNSAEHNLQLAAHLRETLQGELHDAHMKRRKNARATGIQRMARNEVVAAKKHRDELYKENRKLTHHLKLLAHPQLLRDHENVRHRLQEAERDVESLRTKYVLQEAKVSAAREMLRQRSSYLTSRMDLRSRLTSVFTLKLDAKSGPAHVHVEDRGGDVLATIYTDVCNEAPL